MSPSVTDAVTPLHVDCHYFPSGHQSQLNSIIAVWPTQNSSLAAVSTSLAHCTVTTRQQMSGSLIFNHSNSTVMLPCHKPQQNHGPEVKSPSNGILGKPWVKMHSSKCSNTAAQVSVSTNLPRYKQRTDRHTSKTLILPQQSMPLVPFYFSIWLLPQQFSPDLGQTTVN